MKKILILSIFLLLFFYYSFNNIQSFDKNSNNFYLIRNSKLIFLFDNSIDQKIVIRISNNLNNFINEMFKSNKILTDKKININSENILIIFLNDNFTDVEYINERLKKKINKIRKMKNGSDFSRIIFDLNLRNKNLWIEGLYYPYNNIILIKYNKYKSEQYFETILMIILFSELNHYFISNNLLNNFGERYINSIINFAYDEELLKINFFDEAITVFYGWYFTYQYCILYKADNIANLLNMNLSFSDYIFRNFYLDAIKNNVVKIPFKEVKSFLYEGKRFISFIPYYVSLIFYIYQNYNGFDGIRKFINFMYEGKFSSFSDIIYYNFKLSEDKFFEEWENFAKKLFYTN